METKDTQAFNVGLVGSSNFTEPGLTVNVELNLLTTDQLHLKALHEWFEQVWQETEEVHEELLKIIERHLRAFKPFEVWAKALYEYFAGKEKPATHWDENESAVYPLLSKYQQDGYRAALAIAERWGAALICDGVGLGKSFIGLMLLELLRVGSWVRFQTANGITGKVTAWKLYDGVAFRMMKKMQREEQFPNDVDILILSAQHGLIRPNRKIAFYDQRMTKDLAARQASRNVGFLQTFLSERDYHEVFVFAGQTYLAALEPIEAWRPSRVKLTVASGGIGRKMHQMKQWLLGDGVIRTSE